ncbi:Flp pilus assembly protein CpaB [Stenotrophomonas sp. Iso1]|uniref:Flp pilus assembly protein CpaB n=1 Tax=Stenotrophomonas sp. Iso1 TaxID=2977283 RepID=UPI0022B7B5CC|nr:Flp pilus assembly protein CpaB [Stenotrophomonas sp. Iso1]
MPKAIRIAAILLLVLAVLLAILAFGIGRRTTSSPEVTVKAEPAAGLPKRVVVVTTKALPAGQPITAADLSTTELQVAPSEGFPSIADVVGRVPSSDIAAGGMVARAQLLQGIAAGIKPGERAVAIPVDELAGVSNRIAPGDFVDVFMSLQAPSDAGAQRDNPQARLLLSRLRVLGYGAEDVGTQQAAAQAESETAAGQPEPGSRAETIASRSNNSSASGGTNGNAAPPRSAILAVPVQDAGRLLLAAHSGKLFLALRNPGDTALADASIFVAPAPVLPLRRDLDAMDAEAAARPENQAYAGISLAALAGESEGRTARPTAPAIATPVRPRTPRAASRQGIEIIRGTTPSNRLSSP